MLGLGTLDGPGIYGEDLGNCISSPMKGGVYDARLEPDISGWGRYRAQA